MQVQPLDLTHEDPSASRANGETAKQMAHARAKKGAPESTDTSVDQVWVTDTSLRGADTYVMVITGLVLVFKIFVVWLPILFVSLPFTFLTAIFASRLPEGQELVDRRSCSFICFCVTVAPLKGVLLTLTTMSYTLDCFFYYAFSWPYFAGRCCFSSKKVSFSASCKAFAPYRGGPSVVWHLNDVLVALLGQVHRQGWVEGAFKLAGGVTFIPWLKYFVNCNPYIYQLEERFIQQITTSMQDMPLADCANTARAIISRCTQQKSTRAQVDAWSFVPHYSYPPPGRNWALGLQGGGPAGSNAGLSNFFMVVHVTHALKPPPSTELRSGAEYFVFSNSVALPVYRVMLWYSNPYHFFTGFVEASISNGGPSQPDKLNGGEHPMWLVTSRSPLLSDRTSSLGVGWIDGFFDSWLPFFVDLLRTINRGSEAAKELHEEVISKDGVSRPAGRKNLDALEAPVDSVA